MKKSLISVFAGLVSAAAFAGMGNVVISFSTPGPDKYADGSLVQDGETYALVWTKSGSTFEGINPDGTAKGDSKVVIRAADATDHRCPYVQFQVDEGWVNANCPGGTWDVYLLDTRKFKADANGVLLLEDGKPVFDGFGTAVSGYGLVAQATAATMGSAEAVSAVNVKREVHKGTIRITKVDPRDDFVYLYAEGAVDGIPYGMKSADDPGAVKDADAVLQYAKPVDGKMIFIKQRKGNRGFYSF